MLGAPHALNAVQDHPQDPGNMPHTRYSLMRGGLVHRLLQAGGVLDRQHLACWLAALMVLLCVLPLMLLCARAGSLWSQPARMGLIGDYATLSRLLLALPLLVIAAPRCDTLMGNAFRQLSQASRIHPHRSARLHTLLEQIRRWRDAWWAEASCLLIAIIPSWFLGNAVSLLPGIGDWRLADGLLTPAGHWYEWVAVPLFRLVALLWLWRLLLWTLLLWRLPRTGLVLHAEHPDGAGGLAFLGIAQERFAVLALAGGILLSGACVNHMIYLGDTLYSMRHLLAGYVIGAMALLVAPLLLVAPSMIRAKRHALLRFDALGNQAVSAFDKRWRARAGGSTDDSLLDHGDASALADFGGVYQTLSAMSVVPFNRWNLLWIALHAMVPLLPLVLLSISIDDLVKKLLGILV